jgi:hypothetical protein
MDIRGWLVVCVIVTACCFPWRAEAGALGRAVARGTAKSAAKTLPRASTRALRRDLLRDRRTPVRPLPKDRTVYRFTSRSRASQELRNGIPPGSHMTSRGGPGRPPSAGEAQHRYGLPRLPDVRERIHLPAGQPVRPNRVVGGAPGVGELTSPQRIAPMGIERVVPLLPGK